MTRRNGNAPDTDGAAPGDTPIYKLEPESATAYPNGDVLPALWVTEPLAGAEEGSAARRCVMLYPRDADEYGDDPDGEVALYYGGGYYDEGMTYADPANRAQRIACFQAAELLYRHAAGRGNAVANLCLGYVYSYDRCDGRYWTGTPQPEAGGRRAGEAYPRERRAFECLGIAARGGLPEACYKLGDLYQWGTGCAPDADAAFRWYARARELDEETNPIIAGSIALRLGGCYEEGMGCPQDFAQALEEYECAAALLGIAVDGGQTWYARALARARGGAKRCKQELAL